MELPVLDWPHFLAILLTGITTLGGGIWYVIRTLAAWLKPWFEKLFESWIAFIEKLTTQHLVLEQFANSLFVLTQIMSSQQSAIKAGKYIILVVEDNPVDQKFIAAAVMSLMADYPAWREYCLKEVDGLSGAYQHIPFSVLVILDVTLKDADQEHVQAFAKFSTHCPVIIYSGSEQDPKDFPGAAAIIKKGSLAELKNSIKEALTTACAK